jgi:hypothetical protein
MRDKKDIELTFEDGEKVSIEDTTAGLWFVVSRNELIRGKKVKSKKVDHKVPAIECGTTIDHIVRGRGIDI